MFAYDPAVLQQFPTIRAGAVAASGLDNTSATPGLAAELEAVQAEAAEQLAGASLAELPSIAAWRRVFSGFGVSPTKYRNAAEALLRRLTKKGAVPSINPLVDVGNLVSIKHRVPLVVVDVERVTGSIAVRFANGEETFDDLGGTTPEHPEAGEVVFVDAGGATVARRWCWRQSRASAASPVTQQALVVAEAHHDTAADDVMAAAADVAELLRRHLGGTADEPVLLGPDQPAL